jgi:hypothetical protein
MRHALLLAVSASLLPIGAAAHAEGLCAGQYAVIRTSSILPGRMPLFEKAVADQGAWYAGHHDGTTVKLLKVFAKGGQGFSDSQAMTITLHPRKVELAHDQAWTAFVGEYKASSKITAETRACMPG